MATGAPSRPIIIRPPINATEVSNFIKTNPRLASRFLRVARLTVSRHLLIRDCIFWFRRAQQGTVLQVVITVPNPRPTTEYPGTHRYVLVPIDDQNGPVAVQNEALTSDELNFLALALGRQVPPHRPAPRRH
jgi:hypothetical protein